jgi:hypothetical protein
MGRGSLRCVTEQLHVQLHIRGLRQERMCLYLSVCRIYQARSKQSDVQKTQELFHTLHGIPALTKRQDEAGRRASKARASSPGLMIILS